MVSEASPCSDALHTAALRVAQHRRRRATTVARRRQRVTSGLSTRHHRRASLMTSFPVCSGAQRERRAPWHVITRRRIDCALLTSSAVYDALFVDSSLHHSALFSSLAGAPPHCTSGHRRFNSTFVGAQHFLRRRRRSTAVYSAAPSQHDRD